MPGRGRRRLQRSHFAGWLGRPYLQGPLWHAHEMLFGFALAVVVGFLLTAGAAPCHCSASASSKASDGRPG